MKSALKKSVVSTSISLILASGMAAFAAHAADDVKLKATKTNVAFSDFTPTEYSTKGKPNIIVLTMDDLGYGQLPFDKGSFDPKTMENREVVDTYKIGIDKAIEAAQKSTPTLLSLMDGTRCFRPLPRRNNDRSSSRPLWCLFQYRCSGWYSANRNFLA